MCVLPCKACAKCYLATGGMLSVPFILPYCEGRFVVVVYWRLFARGCWV